MSKTKVRVTIAKFDDSGNQMRYANVRENVKIKEFPELSVEDYKPAGGTPLRDATATFISSLATQQRDDRVIVGLLLDESGSMAGNRMSVIASANKFVQEMAAVKEVDPKSAGKVLAVILTDGFENSSRETLPQQLSAKIAEKEAEGWTFIYLGANQDAWSVAQTSGYSGGASGQSVNFRSTPAGTAAAMADVTSNAIGYLGEYDSYMAQAALSSMRTVDEDGSVVTKDGAYTPPAKAAPGTDDAVAQATSLLSGS